MPYTVDDDRDRIDLDAVWAFLGTSAYWGRWRTRADVADQIASAWRVVGCYAPDDAQVGFARAVSDGMSLAYLADVYVLDEHRGHGLGVELVRTMVEQGPGRDFRWLLHTSDAHGLYARFGFAAPDATLLDRPAPPRLAMRPLTAADEAEVDAAQAELAGDDFPFAFRGPDDSFADLLARIDRDRRGVDLPAGRVPATFLVAEIDGAIVGRVSIRHALTPELERLGGHIGYAVRPAFRRRGYATQLLRRGLTICRELGIDRALVTCDDDNAASVATIKRCGGILRDRVSADGKRVRRYDVPTNLRKT